MPNIGVLRYLPKKVDKPNRPILELSGLTIFFGSRGRKNFNNGENAYNFPSINKHEHRILTLPLTVIGTKVDQLLQYHFDKDEKHCPGFLVGSKGILLKRFCQKNNIVVIVKELGVVFFGNNDATRVFSPGIGT